MYHLAKQLHWQLSVMFSQENEQINQEHKIVVALADWLKYTDRRNSSRSEKKLALPDHAT